MNEKELREFRARFDVPSARKTSLKRPFTGAKTRPKRNTCLQRRKELGGFVPKRVVAAEPLRTPRMETFTEFAKGSAQARLPRPRVLSAFCPVCCATGTSAEGCAIIPDEARTFALTGCLTRSVFIPPKASYTNRWTRNGTVIIAKPRTASFWRRDSPSRLDGFFVRPHGLCNYGINLIPFTFTTPCSDPTGGR